MNISVPVTENFPGHVPTINVSFCSNEFVRFVCFCVVHKVFVYCHITSLKGSVGVGRGGG